MLAAQSTPLLSPAAQLEDDGSELSISNARYRLRFEGGSATLLRAIQPLLNGVNSITSLAHAIGGKEREIVSHLSVLVEDGLVIDTSSALRADEPEHFLRAFLSESKFWNQAVFAQPFLRKLFTGKAREPEVLGWGVEFYHFIEGVNEYMAAGVAHCNDDLAVLMEIVRHYVEEAQHSEIFLEGLVGCGLNRRRILTSQPLATTRAIINCFTEIAHRGPLAYASLFGLMQPMGEAPSEAAVRRQYDALRGWYEFATPLFDAFEKHDLIDASLGHSDTTIAKIVRYKQGLTEPERSAAVSALRTSAEHFIFFFEGIGRYYGQSLVMVPRRPADAWALAI